MKNKITIKKSFLESGKDYPLTESLSVKHPTVQEVFDIDEDTDGIYSEQIYYSWVNIFICDPYDYMVYLDDLKIDYETVDSFDVFIILYQDMLSKYLALNENEETNKEELNKSFVNNGYFSAFKFFLGINNGFRVLSDENNEKVLAYWEADELLMNRKMYNYVSEFVKQINGITEGQRINPEDGFAKQILIEDERARLKKLAKNPTENADNDRLGNMLSAITWGGNGGITPFNRNNLHMYDLIDGIRGTDKVFNYNHTMTGLYSGCVDKDKIDMQKVSWQS